MVKAILFSKQKCSRDLGIILHFIKHTIRCLIKCIINSIGVTYNTCIYKTISKSYTFFNNTTVKQKNCFTVGLAGSVQYYITCYEEMARTDLEKIAFYLCYMSEVISIRIGDFHQFWEQQVLLAPIQNHSQFKQYKVKKWRYFANNLYLDDFDLVMWPSGHQNTSSLLLLLSTSNILFSYEWCCKAHSKVTWERTNRNADQELYWMFP